MPTLPPVSNPNLSAMARLALACVALASADQSLSGGGIFMKVLGQSGKINYATSEPINSADDMVQIVMADMKAAFLETLGDTFVSSTDRYQWHGICIYSYIYIYILTYPPQQML